MPTPYQYDSATRAGKGPEFNYFGLGPLAVGVTNGSAPNWTSMVYQNDLGTNPQEVRFRIHNCDGTQPAASSPRVYVSVLLLPPGTTTIQWWHEIYNVGLLPTETWESPVFIPVNPGYQLLVLSNANPSTISVYLDIHSIV